MKKIVETERLYLRDILPGDFDAFFQMHQDPEMTRYIGGVLDEDTTRYKMEKWMAYAEKHPGLGFWALIQKDNEACIGRVSINYLETSKLIEVGYRLERTTWQQGYATEILDGLLAYAFHYLKLTKVVAIAHPNNIASQRVLEKNGFQYEKIAYYYKTDVKFYVLDALRYQENRKPT